MTADWSKRFDDPIPLPGRAPLITLRQAGEYITALPARAQREAHWQIATEMLILAAHSRAPLMIARIAMLRALNHGQPLKVAGPRRKPAKSYRIVS